MRAAEPDSRPPGRASIRPRLLLAGLALACLAWLIVHLAGGGGAAPEGARAPACSGRGAPRVTSVAPAALGALRAAVARVLPERVGHLYEEGTITGSSFWNDDAPSGPTVNASQRRPGGYEMRWWAPNGDDLVADVLVFATPAAAERFLGRASSPRCGASTPAELAGRPPEGRNLAWVNPDDATEADVLLARGRRVYRVADAPSGQERGRIPAQRLRRTFATVDTLACLIPGVHCASASPSVPA